MKKIKLKGNIWYAGSDVFIERFDPSIKDFVEIDLFEFFRDNVEKNSKITMTIEFDDSKQ